MSEPIVAGFEHVDVCAMLGGTPWLCRLHDRAHVTLGPSKSAGLRYQCNWRPLRIQDIIHCMTRPAFDVSQLTPDEKLDLIGELWDSLDDGDIALSPEQQSELQSRLDRVERDGVSGRPWHEVEARLRGL